MIFRDSGLASSLLSWNTEDGIEGLPSPQNDSSKRAIFGSRTEYLLTMVGYTVGLGNIWRWPYMCYSNGGAVFLAAYITCMVVIAMPIFLLEVAIGQKFRSTPVPIWTAISPYLSGLGWAGTASSYFCAWYYNVLCCWSIFYLVASFDFSDKGNSVSGSGLPWAVRSECLGNDGGVQSCSNGDDDLVGSKNITMNATIFWTDTVLQSTHNVNHLGGLNWPVAICLAVAWALVFAIASNGVQSAGRAIYFTATFPYVVLVILLVRGLTLPGASIGLRFLYFVPDASKIFDWRVWANALSQVLYGMGLSTGSITVFGSFNLPTNDIVADTFIIPCINIFTNLLAATVVFSVVGYVAHLNGDESIEGLELSGSALAFQTYSTALATMEGGRLLAPLFFLMLLSLGVDSCFALVELVVATLIDTGLSPFSHPGKQGNWRLSLTVVLATAAPGLLFVTRGGVFYFNVVDAYGIGPVLLVIAALECFGIAWIYGAKRFEDEHQLTLLGLGPADQRVDAAGDTSVASGDRDDADEPESTTTNSVWGSSSAISTAAAAALSTSGHGDKYLEEQSKMQAGDDDTSSVTSDSVSSFAVYATDVGGGLLPSLHPNAPPIASSLRSSWIGSRTKPPSPRGESMNRADSSARSASFSQTRDQGAAAATALVAAALMQQQALAESKGERRMRAFYRAYWRFCRWVWTYLAIPLCLCVACAVTYDAFTMDASKLVCEHPWQNCPKAENTRWAVNFGLCISAASFLCIPVGCLVAVCSSNPQVATGFRVTETGQVLEHRKSLRRKQTRKRLQAKRRREASRQEQQQQQQDSERTYDGDDNDEEWLEVTTTPRVSLNRISR